MPTTHPEISDLQVSLQNPQVNAPQGLKIKATKPELSKSTFTTTRKNAVSSEIE